MIKLCQWVHVSSWLVFLPTTIVFKLFHKGGMLIFTFSCRYLEVPFQFFAMPVELMFCFSFQLFNYVLKFVLLTDIFINPAQTYASGQNLKVVSVLVNDSDHKSLC